MSGGLITLIVAVAVIGYLIITYNGLVRARQMVQEAWSGIDVQLKRRADLIPNLVETVKGYAKHEKETLAEVTEMRTRAQNVPAGDIAGRAAAEGMLSQALGKLFAVAEAYPDLKANENVMKLQEEITATENKVAFARQAFNDGATRYNIFRKSFPTVIVAPLFGHREDAGLLEMPDSAAIQEAPKVSFN